MAEKSEREPVFRVQERNMIANVWGKKKGGPRNASKFLNPRWMEHISRGTEHSPRGAHR